MKASKILAAFFTITITTNAFAQHDHSEHFMAMATAPAQTKSINLDKIDSSTTKQTNDLLTAYYSVKDALVATDGKKASIDAKNLLAKLDAIDQSKMTVEQKTFFKPLNEKISFDAEHINGSQDAEHQREHFGSLSSNILILVKAFGSKEDAFVQYCPMVKKSWLSNNKAVKNPYYGNKMLTCGKVTETISKK
jgi:Protein of unknown function (DUF3347)